MLAALALSFFGCARDAAGPFDSPSADGELFPFVLSYDMAPGVTDFSFLLDAPAGKRGFTRIEDGHFVNDAGRIRFNGVNIAAGSNFPTHGQAARMAARLAHFGFNCVRMHGRSAEYRYRDIREKSLFTRMDRDTLEVDPEMEDRIDYLISQFKKRGIYIIFCNAFAGPENERIFYDPEIQECARKYARRMLTHVNPYTGLSLVDDPVLAMVEINNESSIMKHYRSGSDGWSAEDGRPDLLPFGQLAKASDETKVEVLHALEEYDRAHFSRMRSFLIDELGVKVPVSGTQASYTTPWALEEMDYSDMHAYWCHPNDARKTDGWTIHNLPMVNSDGLGRLSTLGCYRRSGKPFVISEYNNPFPNMYGAEGQPITYAFAAFQDWDAVVEHSYHNLSDVEPDHLSYNFSIASRTDVLAHFISCASMFLRGDVEAARERMVLNLPRDFFEKEWIRTRNWRAHDMLARAGGGKFPAVRRLLHSIEVDPGASETGTFPEEAVGPVMSVDGGQMEWNRETPSRGMFMVRTRNAKLFSGFPEGRTVDLGDGVSLSVGGTKLGWATVSLVSRKGNGFARRSEALLVATGLTQQTGQVVCDVNGVDNGTGQPRLIHCRGDNWGTGPMLTEGIPATLKLPSKARRTRCWALDESGRRAARVPVAEAEDGSAVIEAGPAFRTIWYEIKTK